MQEIKGTCHTCRFRGLQAPEVCALYGVKKPDDGYCDQHKRDEILTCDICGAPMKPSDSIIDENYIICPNCFKQLKTCNLCRFWNVCEYDTNPSPLPKVIQKQIRQGNMVAVTQAINPERVRITCEKGCKCYSTENGCLKQNGTCSNQEVSYEIH